MYDSVFASSTMHEPFPDVAAVGVQLLRSYGSKFDLVGRDVEVGAIVTASSLKRTWQRFAASAIVIVSSLLLLSCLCRANRSCWAAT